MVEYYCVGKRGFFIFDVNFCVGFGVLYCGLGYMYIFGFFIIFGVLLIFLSNFKKWERESGKVVEEVVKDFCN